jgi:ribosomal protein L37AE/L43A
MRDLHCCICDKPLTGRLDTFGDICAELCADCYQMILQDEEEEARIQEAAKPIACPSCGKPMHESMEPGLWHCWDCHQWVDMDEKKAWRYSATPTLS